MKLLNLYEVSFLEVSEKKISDDTIYYKIKCSVPETKINEISKQPEIYDTFEFLNLFVKTTDKNQTSLISLVKENVEGPEKFNVRCIYQNKKVTSQKAIYSKNSEYENQPFNYYASNLTLKDMTKWIPMKRLQV